MKKVFFFLSIVLTCSTSFIYAQQSEIVLVIDAGHGGNDPGHETLINGHSDEKTLNLKIANYFGSYVSKYLTNVRVIYTRTSDKTVSLDDRVEIANTANANYFISIHCNGNSRRSVRGTETHVHSLSIKKSVSLANKIEKQFSQRANRHSRGVKDKEDLTHSLQVLKYTQMTGVLVECGFITNTKEAKYLNSTYGQEIIASAIFRAFRGFIQEQHPTMNFVKPISETTASMDSSRGSFAIQIMSSKTAVDVKSSSFKRLKMDVTRKKLNTTSTYKYIYTVGNYSSISAAKLELSKIQKRGFRDAIIVRQ